MAPPQDATSWHYNLKVLKKYKKKNKHSSVPASYTAECGTNLGTWVRAQRRLYSEGNLLQERINDLNAIGFYWDPFEEAWQEKFKLLVRYKREHGNCLVPQSHCGLGTWVSDQRRFCKQDKLCNDRIARLNSIGFVWNKHDDQWQEHFELLEQYKEEQGNCLIPRGHKTLGIWVMVQRRFYNNNKLSDDRIAMLNSIGFAWNANDDQWQENFDLLEQYYEEHGNCLVPKRHKTLGRWVQVQRQVYKNNKLSDDRITKLNSIGFVWYARQPPPIVDSLQPADGGGTPEPKRKKGRDVIETSSPSPKRRKSGRLVDVHGEQNNTIVRQNQPGIEATLELEDELEEESQNEDDIRSMTSVVDELSKAQLQRIVSILQISHSDVVKSAMSLVNPASIQTGATSQQPIEQNSMVLTPRFRRIQDSDLF